VPVDARPFPAEFRDSDTEAEDSNGVWTPVAAGVMLIGFVLFVRVARARRARKA